MYLDSVVLERTEGVFERKFLVTGQRCTGSLEDLSSALIQDQHLGFVPGLTGCCQVNQDLQEEYDEDADGQDDFLIACTFEKIKQTCSWCHTLQFMNLCLKKSPIIPCRVPKRLASGLGGVKQKAKEQFVPCHALFGRHSSILEVRLMINPSGPKGKEAKHGQLLSPAAKENPRALRGADWRVANDRGDKSS